MRAVSQHRALVIEGKTVEGEAAEEKVVEDMRAVEETQTVEETQAVVETQAVEVKSASMAASYWQCCG